MGEIPLVGRLTGECCLRKGRERRGWGAVRRMLYE